MERSDVIVTGFRLNAAAPPAKVLQAILGLNETDAKALSKRFPCVVLADAEWAEAERISLSLREAGAFAKLRPTGAKSEPPGATDVPKTLPPAPFEATRPAAQASPSTPAPEMAFATPSARPAPASVATDRSPSTPAPAVALATAPSPQSSPAPFFASLEPKPQAPAVASALDGVPTPTASVPAMAAPAGMSAFEMGHAPTLFSTPKAEPEAGPRASLPYALGDLEIAPTTKSTPAPAMPHAAAAVKPVQAAPSQPAPAIKSTPAPAIKSTPAPAPKSQAAPAPNNPNVEATGLRMLDDGFGDEQVDGPALELDYGNVKTTGRVEVKARGKINVRQKEKARGFWATLLLPIVLLQAAVPHALALTGVAAASGAAVYIARTSAKEKEAATAEDDAPNAEGKQPTREKRGGLLGFLDDITGRTEDKAGGDEDGAGGAEGKTDSGDAANKGVDGVATEATHPLVKMAPKSVEPAIASILRQRFRGLHKVMVEWPEGQKPEGKVECMLLEQEHASGLKELLSTGRPIAPPIAVREQLQDHIGVLRAADANPDAAYIPICLAN